MPVPDAPGHVMYVWVDALTNYVTGAGFPDQNNPRWRYWPADVHIIGKDIVRFHAVYWPAFLMSAGLELPKKVFGHGFLFNRGEKMSKSVGNVIDPFALADAYGVDSLRYFFLREVPFGQDGNYSHEAIVNRINADLANDLGNLAQRSLTMIARNCGGAVPEPGSPTPPDQALLAAAYALPEKARERDEGLRPPYGSGRHLGRRRRGESILCVTGALGPAKTGSCENGHRALDRGRGAPHDRHSGSAVRTGSRGEAPGSSRAAAG